MKRAAFLLALLLAPIPAGAVQIHGLTVVDVGTPACAMRNPSLRTNAGQVVNNLVASQDGFADPWAQWPKFLGSPYSALRGTHVQPAEAVLRYPGPRSTFSLVWGTPDIGRASNWIGFYRGKTLVAYLNGDEVLEAFGPANPSLAAVNLSIRMPPGETYDGVLLIAASPPGATDAFEIANLNTHC